MSIAIWQDDYCTGHAEIDQEHQDLFSMVNALHDALEHRESEQTLRALLSVLATHTVQHFQTEEALMQRHHYPGYERHKQVHDGLTTKVVNLLDRFDQHAASLTVDLTTFLSDWLVHHIRGEDQKMIQFFRQTYKDSQPMLELPTSLTHSR